MTTKLVKTIVANHLHAANPRSKNVHVGRHSERSEESLTSSFCFLPIHYRLFTIHSKSIFGRTNPIQKSITYYKERSNPKNAKQKQTQTKPMQRGRSFQLRVAPTSAACGWSVIPAKAGIQVLLLEAGSWLLEAVSQKTNPISKHKKP